MTNAKIIILAGIAVVTGLAADATFDIPALSRASAATAPSAYTAITVYELPNFKGRSLTFERSVPSLAARGFNDKTASVQIDGTRDWVLCEHRNFMGKCVRVHMKAKDLKRMQIAGQVSSLYPVPVERPARR